MKLFNETRLIYFLLPLIGAGCSSRAERPAVDAGIEAPSAEAGSGPAATHEGTISIQDRSIHGLPQAGHGLTVVVELTRPWRRPDFDDMPGSPAGCKVWRYDVTTETPPALLGDVGVVTIAGTSAPLPQGCWYEPPIGTVCPAISGRGRASLRHAGAELPVGTARFELSEGRFGPDERGRYLAVAGDPPGGNDGLYPILDVLAPSTLLLRKPLGPDSEDFVASYRTLAGVGITPGMPHQMPGDPLLDGDQVTVGFQPAGAQPFQFPATMPIPAGASFTLDPASDRILGDIPLDGGAFSIGCGGPGGSCGPAQVSILRILTTDGATDGLPPFAMPPSQKYQLEISCAEAGGDGVVDVPPEVSRYLEAAHKQQPITRIRTAFMRNGFTLASNPPPLPRNTVRIVVGHQILGFMNPMMLP